MNTRPTFTIIVPTYNQADYLGKALDSLLAQTDPDWEAVVVNDGSTDSTPAVMQSYELRDQRIKGFSKPNGGTGSALNYGLRQATGTWICWLSSDDLFDKHKLEIHREWITKEPGTSFFHTHFFVINEPNSQLESPPLWRAIPEREWQLLEMFRQTYIHGISICIRREAIEHIGKFDESLCHGQDYDMWLRLLTRYPATFIPERTCVQRDHSNQSTHAFPEAGMFDSSKAAINLLNRYKFEQLFPLVDLADPEMAKKTIERALDVARAFKSRCLYGLGPHPALLWRIIEWVLKSEKNTKHRVISKLVEKDIQDVLKRNGLDPAIRLQWKSAFAILRLREGDFDYIPLSPDVIAARRYWQLRADKSEKSGAFLRYLLSFGYRPDSAITNTDSSVHSREVVMVCQLGVQVDAPIKNGAARAFMELAQYLVTTGRQVLLIGISNRRLGFTEGIQFMGVQSETALFNTLRVISPIDTLIGDSRSDIFIGPTVKRTLIYQHGPGAPEGDHAIKFIRNQKLHIAVVSKYSMKSQQQYGTPKEQIHLIYNCYNSDVFKLSNNKAHAKHRVVFAGDVVPYKGLDIAVQAFAVLRNDFSDAEFHIFGNMQVRLNKSDHLWPADWLDEKGRPIWIKIEQELSGLRYFGKVTQEGLANAFQEASLLVMPSRINETFGLVSLEAQACGCIPVLPRQGGFPETVREGITGYLYDDNTPENLAQFIANLWAKRLPSEEQRSEAAGWVKQEFSRQKTCGQIVELLAIIPQRKNNISLRVFVFMKITALWMIKMRKLYSKVASHLIRKILKKPFRLLLWCYYMLTGPGPDTPKKCDKNTKHIQA